MTACILLTRCGEPGGEKSPGLLIDGATLVPAIGEQRPRADSDPDDPLPGMRDGLKLLRKFLQPDVVIHIGVDVAGD